jgi:hypothetical protein
MLTFVRAPDAAGLAAADPLAAALGLAAADAGALAALGFAAADAGAAALGLAAPSADVAALGLAALAAGLGLAGLGLGAEAVPHAVNIRIEATNMAAVRIEREDQVPTERVYLAAPRPVIRGGVASIVL